MANSEDFLSRYLLSDLRKKRDTGELLNKKQGIIYGGPYGLPRPAMPEEYVDKITPTQPVNDIIGGKLAPLTNNSRYLKKRY